MKKTDPHPKSWEIIQTQLSDQRRKKLEAVASRRTDYLTVVLQGIHDPHNVSACIRSAEALGIQNIHIIPPPESSKSYKATTPAKGARDWVDINRYRSIQECADTLKEKGYRLMGAYPPSQRTVSLAQIGVNKPVAVVFGNEHAGLDPSWAEILDGVFTIPMYGMVESFNISVAAAISLFTLQQKALNLLDKDFFIPQDRQLELLNKWALKQRRHSQKIITEKTKNP